MPDYRDYEAMADSARERARQGYYADGQMASIPSAELYALADAVEKLAVALSPTWEEQWNEFLRGGKS